MRPSITIQYRYENPSPDRKERRAVVRSAHNDLRTEVVAKGFSMVDGEVYASIPGPDGGSLTWVGDEAPD